MLSDVRIDGDQVYWLEGRPQEQGRNVIVRAGPDGVTTDITPAGFNVRTRVHEYGGGAWLVADGTAIFSNFADQRLYRQRAGQAVPEPLTPEPASCRSSPASGGGEAGGWRYGDGVLDHRRRRWIGVREDHSGEGEPANAIVAIDLDHPGSSAGRVLAGAHDFLCSARLSPDGNRMLWLAWDHPNMPWNGTTLYLAEIDASGAPAGMRAIAGDIEVALREAGFSKPAFETIVASGPNSALPHARPTSRAVQAGEATVLDFGGVYDGYCVDLTRTVQVGAVSANIQHLYAAVAEAQQAAIRAVRPGETASVVDAAARSVLERHGLGAAFGHGTGHGLGLEVHEEPRIGRATPRLPDERLEPGMVFTIEPGAYVPGVGGVRIEDDILVTVSGCEVLTQ